MLAVCVVALFSFIALAVDIGVLMIARSNAQNAADAASLVGARLLDNKVPSGISSDAYDNNKVAAETAARACVTNNFLMNANFSASQVSSLRIGLYDYDGNAQTFSPTFPDVKPAGKAWSCCQVTVNGDQPTYFARIFGISSMPTSAVATAVHRPRDVALVLDFTGSMGYSSLFNVSGRGYNSSDPIYPQFAHYQRYLVYSNGNPYGSDSAGTAPASRQNPLYQTGTVVSAPYVYSPVNGTVTTPNGPPIVRDYRFDPSNISNPSSSVVSVNSANLANAFHATTFSATVRTSTTGPTPAPDDLAGQSHSRAAFSSSGYGDRWPRKRGADTGTTWDPTNSTGAAITAAEYLGWVSNYSSGSSLPSTIPSSAPSRTWSNFRDATWERYGYTLDVADYIANRNNGLSNNAANNNGQWDPRWDAGKSKDGSLTTDNPPTQSTYTPITNLPFNGYTLGPTYWGKTFFIWPPDPRPTADWRRLYFLNRSGVAFATGSEPGANLTASEVDADPVASGIQNVNQELFTNGTGATLLTATNNYTINYPAVLAWIKSGPQTLPPNLRAGRVRYYTSIPDDVNTSSGTADERLDKAFWRGYIDFVLNGAANQLAGTEPVGWPEGVTPSIASGERTGFATPTSPSPWSSTSVTDPRPYMTYTDNPSRPRMHFWFGPITMLSYIHNRWDKVTGRSIIAGTVHEAQLWQLKVGVNSALDDMRANHPNDTVGMAFFSTNDYNSIIVNQGQDWDTLKNSLFYPFSLLGSVTTNTSAEFRPYTTSLGQVDKTNIPNSKGSTDPNTGLSLAYNLLSPSPNVNSDVTRRGRRGAAKIVIFETDGIPNATQPFTFNPMGYDSHYTFGSGTMGTAQEAAYAVISQIVKPAAITNASGVDSGHSLPNAPARVYSMGFGDIFSTSAGPAAASFLLEIQKRGNTSSITDTAIPDYQIITGEYQSRIDNLRTAFEKILQSGVQVTLIE